MYLDVHVRELSYLRFELCKVLRLVKIVFVALVRTTVVVHEGHDGGVIQHEGRFLCTEICNGVHRRECSYRRE